jgi:cytochrome c oxidase subunit 4
MSDAHAHDAKKHIRIYVVVFVALALLTAVTVMVASLEHSVKLAVSVARFIAVVKGSLVAGYFMHLISERKALYSLLILTGILFVALLFLPLAAQFDQQGVPHVS